MARASGGDLLLTDIFTAQDLLGKPGVVDRVDIVLDPGTSREPPRREIARRLPPGLTARAAGPRGRDRGPAWSAPSAST